MAIAAMAPPPFYFVFVDEVEILGRILADAGSQLPVQSALAASGAQQLQEVLDEQKQKVRESLQAALIRPRLRQQRRKRQSP